jgi:AraC-like DNA-binding protein
MDALSDLLRVVRMSAGVFLDAEFTAPWCITSQVALEDCRLAMSEPALIIAFHYVVEGRLVLQAPGQAALALREGSIVLLPRNDPHKLGSMVGLPAQSGEQLMRPPQNGGLARIRHGGGGEPTRIVCGFIGTDARRHPLMDALPPLLVLDLAGKPASEWVASSFRYAAAEVAAARAGSAVVLAKLSELLFVEAVREYVDTMPAGRTGWLSGLRDPVVGRALALLHEQVDRPWTAEELAREVCLSRSAFAERFTALLGVPPMKYLASWRMQVAAQRLRESQRPVASIAAEVGYESDAAFTRAFKREFSLAPAAWRRRAAAENGAR